MKPVKTDRSNFIMRGPTVDIGDVWTEIVLGEATYVDWLPTEAELAALASGSVIRLGIIAIPMPPVSLEVRPDLRVLSDEPPPIVEAKA